MRQNSGQDQESRRNLRSIACKCFVIINILLMHFFSCTFLLTRLHCSRIIAAALFPVIK
jgi:hypothetical protein